ncbi:MAG: error-prone DNA polymerase, partial [Gemmatimonadota bacterium]
GVGPGSRRRDGEAHGRTGACGCPGCRALERTGEIAETCDFRLSRLEPALPAFPVPGGRDAQEFLGGLVEEGARTRYGERLTPEHRRQLERELEVIGRLGLAGYFLIVWDIVRFANRRGILVQGRGSAANSAVCYCLGITAVDPIGLDLLFERFLSEERDEAPDIDLDIAHRDREEVLQYVYRTYGREHAAMVCETITYRGRMAVRDAARVLGFPTEVADALSVEADLGEATAAARRLAEGGAARAGLDPAHPRTRALLRAVAALDELPRHRSIHVGGFVLSAEPIGRIVPVERASMPDRTVIQWDKDDLDLPGLIKFDLLGLGMLTVLGDAVRHVRRTRDVALDLARIPPDDPDVYDMICAADTVGLFQIESRAQMNTLPRMKPRCFYDLVIEVALIRPGPIQGEMVHPYLRRRRGEEPVTYLDPRLEPILKRTRGVPLFQEQGMKVAVALAGYTPAQADRLRRAMGFKRSRRAMEEVGRELAEGLRRNGVSPEVEAQIFQQLTAFANYGFPESHAASFALLVYASAYLKRYYAPEYFCAMLNAQPMGFYSPSTLVHDARRHGVEVRPVELARSEWDCTLEPREGELFLAPPTVGSRGGAPPSRLGGCPLPVPSAGESPEGRSPALRLGLRLVRGLGPKARERLQRAREEGPFGSVEDVVRRCGLGMAELRTLAEAGAFDSLWPGRREALWELLRRLRGDAGPLAPRWPEPRRSFRPLSRAERVLADYRTLGLSAEGHPMEFLRAELQSAGILRAAELAEAADGTRVRVAGIPICRQRPSTAKGVMFVTLEDETGFANFVVLHDVQERYHATLIRSPVLLLEGVVEREEEVVNVRARKAEALPPRAGADSVRARDFR